MSVRPGISDVFIIHVGVKGGIFEFIGLRRMKNSMVLCELHQDWLYFLVYKTRMPHSNVMKNF